MLIFLHVQRNFRESSISKSYKMKAENHMYKLENEEILSPF